MGRFIVRRLLWMLPTLLGITLLVFTAVRVAPGDPTLPSGAAEAALGVPEGGLAQRVARLRAEHLLDRPLLVQYLHFLGPFHLGAEGHRWFGGSGLKPWHGLLALDFGDEVQRPGVKVGPELLRRLRVTVPLSLAALLLTYLIAVPLGAWCAVRSGRPFERLVTLLLFLAHALPAFWVALLLILLFGGTGLGWLPILGLTDPDAAALPLSGRALDLLRHALLPVAALTLPGLAYLSRQTRAGLLEVLRSDFVRTARAAGLSARRVLFGHALRNALLPLITLSASVLPTLIGGSVVVESVFGIEGLGKYAYDALLARDLNVILAVTTLSALLTLLGILLADVLYAWADPRVRQR